MDIALLINKYLEDKAHLRDPENDSINIVDNQIVSWSFANIPCPTAEELEALVPVVESETNQAQINAEARAYLASTDWYILREMDGGAPCPQEIKDLRAAARLRVI